MTDSVISRFDIQLDAGDTPIFKGGEVITGKLLIELRRSLVINAIKLQMKGRAVWVNDPMKKDDIEKVLFDNDFTLLERPPGKLEPGHFTWVDNFTYSLPFECPLPKGCPTSYEGPYAFIRYFIRASLVHEEADSKVQEYYVKKAFCIVQPSDGHLVVGESQGVSDTATFGKCCCKGKLSAEFTLPKTGYLPGEEIVGNLKIGNKHPKGILQQMEVRLVDRARRVGAAEISDATPWRTLAYRKLEEDSDTPKKAIEKHGIYLMTVPPVTPTTKGDFGHASNEIHSLSPVGRLLESPSTATLRFRRQPFLKIEYAIQLSLGPFLLLEIPIDIGEHSTRDKSITLEPFVCGAQPIEERDEAGKIPIGGPFTYIPVYPYKENVTARMVNDHNAYTPSIPTIMEESALPNGSHMVTETRHKQETVETPHEQITVTTTKTIVTHVDGHETKTMEETVVDKGGEVTRTVEQTVLSDDGMETHVLEVTKIDSDGHENVVVDMTERQISEDDVPEALEEAKEKMERIFDDLDHPNENEDLPVATTSNLDGEETIVTTEEFEHDGVKTIRTTTVTKHADGSESTLVQEQSEETVTSQ